MTRLLKLEQSAQGVARIILNRPEVHNAFNDVLIEQLTQTLEQLGQDPAVRVVVLTGEGHSFCAGADLNWMRAMVGYDEATNHADATRLATLMDTLANLPKPTIARVNGAAYGGGVGLVACCDMAVALEGASFALTEVKLGLVPAVISPYVITAIGERQARRWFLTAEAMSASVAESIGLVHEVAAEDMLDDVVDGWIRAILRAGPQAVSASKRLIARISADCQLRDGRLIDDTTKLIAQLRVSEEGQEGLSAFLEKRKPKWQL
ncbi:enoyl-CoA hydratase/isomerase family protein [Leeia aquatica]|uniref:Enoyl-CoA hydratase/isomerase family protein n=1 Tax=Leeia aquatica TaxID=2725557 RepID=A0A847SDB9_9NEIS|nr:enoyl-CoA hydratase/isomerase family protein [Leeia aquatica]NLR73942.1 enoyl-CoA hydratase/isomerase family protein [Leeia aquatica]